MIFQDGGRNEIGFIVFQSFLNSVCFDSIGDTGNNAPALENLVNRHRNCLLWNFVNIRKPTFMDLLVFAGIVEIYDDVCLSGIKISRRIVKGDVRVFTNADEPHVHRFFPQRCRDTGDALRRAVYQVRGLAFCAKTLL